MNDIINERNNNNDLNAYQDSKKRKKYLIFVIILITFLGIGYAYLQTTLNISGTTHVGDNSWNVYWNNIVDSGVSNASVTASPNAKATISDAPINTEITFSVSLSEPGDYYEFKVNAVNAGSLAAEIYKITKTVKVNGQNETDELPPYLRFDVTYEDDVPLHENQILEAAHNETYKIRVEYKKNVNSGSMPTAEGGDTIICTFGVNYIQAGNSVIPIKEVYYSIDTTNTTQLGSAKPATYNGTTTFDNDHLTDARNAAATAFTNEIYLKHSAVAGNVALTSVNFKKSSLYYELKGGSQFYEANKAILDSAFTASKCRETLTSSNYTYACADGNLSAETNDQGYVLVVYGASGSEQGCTFKPANSSSICGAKTAIIA